MNNPFLTAIFFLPVLIYFAVLTLSIVLRKGSQKRAILTGGGSSGHIYPAIAIGKSLEPEVNKFLYIGGKGRIEEVVVPKEGIPLKTILALPYPERKSKLPFFLCGLFLGMVQAFFPLLIFQPRYLIATGGFVSAPVIFSAFLLKITGLLKVKIFLHEQNVTPGKLNLLASSIADRVLVTFPQSIRYFGNKAVLIGYPTRKFIKHSSKEDILKKLNIPSDKMVLFAFGGSQGSRTINRAIVSALKHLLKFKDKIFIILSCGLGQSHYNGLKDIEDYLKNNFSENAISQINEFFLYKPYFFNIDEILHISSLVVARSGAGTLFELSSFELPSILIPKLGLSNEHQVMNAMAMEQAKGAVVLFERPTFENSSIPSVEGEVLAKTIADILFSETKLEEMREGAKKFTVCPDTYKYTKKIILQGEETKNEVSTYSPFLKLKPPSSLLHFLQNQKEKEKENFTIENHFNVSEINFYKSITLKLLSSRNWKEKNVGVKLAAFFKTDDAKKILFKIASDREIAPFSRRIFGEKFKTVAFLRRNSFISLKEYSLSDTELHRILKPGLSDPYYETRSASLSLAVKEKEKLAGNREFVEYAKNLSKENEFEVAKEAINLLGKIGGEEELDFILSFKDHFFWQVREAALLAVSSMIERGVNFDKEKLKKELLKFNLTATDYKPFFTIKQNFKKVFEMVEKN